MVEKLLNIELIFHNLFSIKIKKLQGNLGVLLALLEKPLVNSV